MFAPSSLEQQFAATWIAARAERPARRRSPFRLVLSGR